MKLRKEEGNLLRWSGIYKGLANPNRLKILKLLKDNKQMSVGELKDELKISFKNTSWNLKILRDLELVEYKGMADRVYYSLNPKLAKEIAQILQISIFN